MAETVTAKCYLCNGEMRTEVVSKFSPGVGVTTLGLGVLTTVSASLLLGLPIVIIGAYLGWASKGVWRCPECGAVVERVDRAE